MALLLKLLLILILAITLPVIGIFMLGQSWLLGLVLMVAPTVLAYRLF